MWGSPYARRAASRLWALQRTLQLSAVDGPPRPRGTTWSISSRTVEPQMPPSWVGHWQRFPSRVFTSLFTFAGTAAFRFSCCARSNATNQGRFRPAFAAITLR